jgi:hypothetical protein
MIAPTPVFETKDELYGWLHANKSALIAQKKSAMKEAEPVSFVVPLYTEKGEAVKFEAVPEDSTKIKVQAIINTTKIMDSHGDVHMDGLWQKSINETKDNYLVQEHNFTFEGIISDNVKVYTKNMTWKELGADYPGFTQALVYEAIIDKADSPLMFDKYRAGKVKQHSVGMRYVKIDMAINSPLYPEEKEIWDKYINQVVNRDAAEEQGYFWPVTEAKNVEGSAVVRGSNTITPTQSVEQTKNQPGNATEKQEPEHTPIDVNKLITHYKTHLTNG